MNVTKADIEMLKIADVPSHGVILEPGTTRDRLRKYGLIVGNYGKASLYKRWRLTTAGREMLNNYKEKQS